MAAVAAAGPIRIQLMTRDGVRAPGDPLEGTTDYLDVREGLTGSPMAEVTARQMQRLPATGEDRVAVLRQFLGVLSDNERALIELIGRIDEDDTR
jgi:hypothetical protein